MNEWISDWLLVFLVIGATARLTRLVTADYVTRHWREWAERRGGAIEYFSTCDWCVSTYTAPPVVVAAVWWGDNRVVIAILLALTASMVTGLLTRLEEA